MLSLFFWGQVFLSFCFLLFSFPHSPWLVFVKSKRQRKFLQETSSNILCTVAGQRDHRSYMVFCCHHPAPFGVGGILQQHDSSFYVPCHLSFCGKGNAIWELQTPARRRDQQLKRTRPPRNNIFLGAIVMWLSLKLGDEM